MVKYEASLPLQVCWEEQVIQAEEFFGREGIFCILFTKIVTVATLAVYQDLKEFERGVIVDAREMGQSIFEVVMKCGFSRTTVSRVYSEYRESGKTSNLRHCCDRKKNVQERDQRRLTCIIKRERRAVLPQIATDFNLEPSISITG
ncbi:HTH_Tnp_Tc3_2 domain-containing protein [Trichonephila clavipes]|nr:HTH_Tnp_Tc3_2 domain-containing protein [Trichonephila clavipes]